MKTLTKTVPLIVALAALAVALATAGPALAHGSSPATAGAPATKGKPRAAGYRYLQGQGLSRLVGEGVWRVMLEDGSTVLTHGGDPAPPRTMRRTPAAAAARPPVCAENNPNGNNYLVAIIAWPYDIAPDETDVSLRGRIATMNGLLHAEAVESGSPDGADYVFACDPGGQVRVDQVSLPTPSAQADWVTIISDLQALGYDKPNEKYVIWYDDNPPLDPGVCGRGTFVDDESNDTGNRNNFGPSYGITYGGITYGDCGYETMMHELGHTLGAVQYGALHSTGAAHCWQGQNFATDVMCYNDGGPKYPGYLLACDDPGFHFDCAHDDYFDAKVGAGEGGGSGSYLDLSWNLGGCYVRWIVNYACAGDGADTAPPSAPTDLRATTVAATEVGLAWAASSDDVGVSGYEIYRDGLPLATTGPGTTYTDRDVRAATTYSYTVRAFDEAGNVSPFSAPATVATPEESDTAPPTAPRDVTATAVGSTGVGLAWAAATDDVGVAGYEVYRNGLPLATTGAGTTYTDGTVRAATRYSYTVRAFDGAGNLSAFSAPATVTTPEAADTTAPVVVSVRPRPYAGRVSRLANVTIAFSQGMDRASVESAFTLVRRGRSTQVAGQFRWRGNTLVFDPRRSLDKRASYVVRLRTTATDLAGNRLEQETIYQFTVNSRPARKR